MSITNSSRPSSYTLDSKKVEFNIPVILYTAVNYGFNVDIRCRWTVPC